MEKNSLFPQYGHVGIVEAFDGDERTMTQYIIGAVSEMDTPLNPAARGLRSMSAYLTSLTLDDLQKERDEVLSATQEDIRALAAHIRAFMQDDCMCVVGNEEKLREEEGLFLHLESLY